jgi:hypothetical protein
VYILKQILRPPFSPISDVKWCSSLLNSGEVLNICNFIYCLVTSKHLLKGKTA